MPTTSSAIYSDIVRELAPDQREPGGTLITVCCEPPGVPGSSGARGTMSMRLKAGTTAEDTRAIASTLQARAKGLCHQKASSAEAG